MGSVGGLVEEGGEGAGGGGFGGGFGEADFIGGAAGFAGGFEGGGHAGGIGGDGDGGVDQDGVGAEFEGFGGVAGGADAGIDDDGDGGLGEDDFDLPTGRESLVGADGGAEGHDGGGADILQAAGEDGIGVDVGEDGEALIDEDFGGFEGLDGVGEEVAGVGVDFEFDPVGHARRNREAGEAHWRTFRRGQGWDAGAQEKGLRPRDVTASQGPWPHNALRHTFASMHYAQFQNEHRPQALMEPESATMVYRHY